MGQIRDRMEEDLKLAKYSPSTRRIYIHYAKQFTKFFMRSPAEMGEEEVRKYLLHLLEDRKLSHGSYRQCYAALKFLYKVTLKRPFEVETIPRPRMPRRLPNVLSGSEVIKVLEAIKKPRHRLVAMLAYGAGLRVSEACCLRVSDIDSKRRLIHIRLAKGGHDRFVILSHRLLIALRTYWKAHRHTGYLFPGSNDAGHMSPATFRHVIRKAGREAKLSKRVTPHLLRHTFATHLLEIGTDTAVIQALLGHRDLRATMHYTQVSNRRLQNVSSPLDLLGRPEGTALG